jgi:hypothetical protein
VLEGGFGFLNQAEISFGYVCVGKHNFHFPLF